ncbi:MAG: DegV family protein [Anaerolineae bacterium]
MAHVAVVTDGGAAMPPELVEEYDIAVVPFQLMWEGETLRDGIDITPTQFYRRLRTAKSLPTTSQPLAGDFVRLYSELGGEAEAIASIHVAKEFSGTYNTALLAAKQAATIPIEVVDSRTATMGLGFLVLEAARAATKGASLSEVVARVKSLIPKVHVLATLDTLEYLRRSGRVPTLKASLGSMLNIKPVFHLYDGQARLYAQVRSRKRAVQIMVEAMPETAERGGLHIAVLHADAPGEAQELKAQILSRFDPAEIYVAEFSPVMGTHTGPGLLGITFYVDG